MKNILLSTLIMLCVTSMLMAQGNAAKDLDNIKELYRTAKHAEVVMKATALLAKPGLTKNDSIQTVYWLCKSAAQNKQPDIALQYLATLVKLDPNTDFDGDKEPALFGKVWFKFAGETKYVPGQRQSKLSIAVVEFDNGSFEDADKVKSAGIGISAMLRYDLESSGVVYSPSREHFNYLLDELKLSQSEMVDKDQKLEVGKVIGVKKFVFGTFFNMPKGKFRIDARIINTETTLPDTAFKVEGKSDDIGKVAAELTKQILTYLKVKTEAIKKAGANVPDVNLAALLKYSQGVAFQEKGQLEQAKVAFAEAVKLSPSFPLFSDRQQRVEVELNSNHE